MKTFMHPFDDKWLSVYLELETDNFCVLLSFRIYHMVSLNHNRSLVLLTDKWTPSLHFFKGLQPHEAKVDLRKRLAQTFSMIESEKVLAQLVIIFFTWRPCVELRECLFRFLNPTLPIPIWKQFTRQIFDGSLKTTNWNNSQTNP